MGMFDEPLAWMHFHFLFNPFENCRISQNCVPSCSLTLSLTGFKVVVGDKVVLMPVNAGQPLHASNIELLDNLGCKEVGLVYLYCSYRL